MLRLDHIVLSATDLARDATRTEAQLALPLGPGGQHGAMGTHNRLLSLGPDCYLELIAADPDAPAPDQPRWYALDQFTGPPRLTHWAAACDDLPAALAQSPDGAGRPWALSRDDLTWQMAIPPSGQTPMQGLWPALLQWDGPHPAPNLADHGARLTSLTLRSPDADILRRQLAPLLDDSRITITHSETAALNATLSTPKGPVYL